MRYDDIRQTITSSSPDDWVLMSEGPIYLDSLGEAISGDQRSVIVETHRRLAVYKPDISTRLAWGLELDASLPIEDWTWPDRLVSRFIADAFLQGALVSRWTFLQVDGGRSYLPDPEPLLVKTGDTPIGGYQMVGRTARNSEINLARLLQDLAGRPEGDFDRYLEQSGIVGVPDD